MTQISFIDILANAFGDDFNFGNPPNTIAVAAPFDLKSRSFETSNGSSYIMPSTINGWQLPLEQLIEINGKKILIKTPIDGQKGTFKEMFAEDDWQIIIRGVLVQDDGTNNFPKAQ